jgi:hypothetical protein
LTNAESLAASDAAVLKATPIGTENKLLLVLLSFLSDSHVSMYIFSQAVMPRKMWATDGGVETSSSEWVLSHILSTDAAFELHLIDLWAVSGLVNNKFRVFSQCRYKNDDPEYVAA